MRRLASVSLLLALALPAGAQSIKLPASLTVAKPGLVTLVPESVDADAVAWIAVDDGLQLIPSTLLKDDKTAVGVALLAGSYRVRAVAAKAVGGKAALSAVAECTVVVGTPPVPPVPPGPNPPVPPGPTPGPAPIPVAGFRVMMIEDVANRSKLPAAQLAAMFNASVIGYLDSHCVKAPDGSSEWRRWDAGTDATGDEKHWVDALKLQPADKTKLPWLIVSDGKQGYSGPLPANEADMLTLLKKYGG